MSIPPDINDIIDRVRSKCRLDWHIRDQQEADWEDFVQAVLFLVVSRWHEVNEVTTSDELIKRAIWCASKTLQRIRKRQQQILSQAQAAKEVDVNMPDLLVEQKEMLAKITDLAKEALTEPERLAITNPERIREMYTGSERSFPVFKHRFLKGAVQKLRKAASSAGLLGLLLGLNLALALCTQHSITLSRAKMDAAQNTQVGAPSAATAESSRQVTSTAGIPQLMASAQSCRTLPILMETKEMTVVKSCQRVANTMTNPALVASAQSCRSLGRRSGEMIGLAGIQSCHFRGVTERNAVTLAGIQSCSASARANIRSCPA
jgi:hypothetical protein